MSAPAPVRFPWLGFAAWSLAAFGFFYAWVLRVSPSVMVEPLMAEFEVGGALIGTLSGLYFYTYALLQAPAGLAMDRWGPRKTLAVAILLAGVGSALFAAAPSIEVAYLGRLLIGAGVAFPFLGSMVLAAAWFPLRRFAMLSGLAMGFGMVGGIAGQAPLALAVGAVGWRETMLLLGAGAIVLAAAIALIARDRPAGAAPLRAGADGGAVLRDLWLVVRRPQTLLIAAFAGLMSSPILAFGALWGVPYTMHAYGLDKAEAASAMAPILVGFAAGAPAWGWVSDRIGRRKLPMLAGATLGLAAVGGAIYLPALALAVYSGLLFLIGFGGAAMAVSYAAAREHNAAGGTGGALGFVNTVSVLGGALFQPLVGLLLDLQWDGSTAGGARVYSIEAYGWAFSVLPVCYVVALCAAAGVRETHCRPFAAAPARA